jgi:hypothetical protein
MLVPQVKQEPLAHKAQLGPLDKPVPQVLKALLAHKVQLV